jgi:hypothetical protein
MCPPGVQRSTAYHAYLANMFAGATARAYWGSQPSTQGDDEMGIRDVVHPGRRRQQEAPRTFAPDFAQGDSVVFIKLVHQCFPEMGANLFGNDSLELGPGLAEEVHPVNGVGPICPNFGQLFLSSGHLVP